MPLPSDEKLLQLADDLIRQLDTMFGEHPGFRPAHAKGVMLTGTFTPSEWAGSLTRAPHITGGATPVTMRFSNSTGLPMVPDNDPTANPRGLGIRFHLGGRVHTDIIGHSADGFPARTGGEFLEFLRAAAASASATSSPTPIEQFLGAHPAAKPCPASFATEAYFGVTAFRFISQKGLARFGRYRIVPAAGIEHLDEASAQNQGPNYLFDELGKRIARGPVGFEIQVQIAAAGDTVDDATVHWPNDRPVVSLGRIELTAVAPDDERHRRIIFDPIPRVEGIEASDDPLLELRAAVYLMSGRRRRQASEAAAASG